MLRVCLLVCLFMAPAASAWASFPEATTLPDTTAPGAPALRARLLAAPEAEVSSLAAASGPAAPRRASGRSVPLALLASGALPGAGQAYNRQWIKTAAFLGAEAAVILVYAGRRSAGRDDVDAYQAYAHAHWSPLRYAAWLQDYSDWLPDRPRAVIEAPQGIDFTRPEAWSADEHQRVRTFFSQMRAAEDRLYHPETGAVFSHKLPYHGEQQYYELIGKYFQFAPGWEDYPAWRDAEGQYIAAAIDPERTGADGGKPNVQGRFRAYARDHAAANDLLRQASRLSALIVVNHIASAIDAAVFAKLHNDRVQTRASLERQPGGGLAPGFALSAQF